MKYFKWSQQVQSQILIFHYTQHGKSTLAAWNEKRKIFIYNPKPSVMTSYLKKNRENCGVEKHWVSD